MAKTKVIGVRMPLTLLTRLNIAARVQRTTKSQVVREALRAALRRPTPEPAERDE